MSCMFQLKTGVTAAALVGQVVLMVCRKKVAGLVQQRIGRLGDFKGRFMGRQGYEPVEAVDLNDTGRGLTRKAHQRTTERMMRRLGGAVLA